MNARLATIFFTINLSFACGKKSETVDKSDKSDKPLTGLATVGAGKSWLHCFELRDGKGVCVSPKGTAESLREVDLAPFEIDRLAVIGTDYQKCVDAGKCAALDAGTNLKYPVMVKAGQAKALCAFRGMSLPTEAEWEKAARGANDPRAYPWGNERPTCKVVAMGGCTEPPDGLEASPYGVYGLVGHLEQWTLPYEQRSEDFQRYMFMKGLPATIGKDRDIDQRLKISYEMQSDGSGEAGIRCVRRVAKSP